MAKAKKKAKAGSLLVHGISPLDEGLRLYSATQAARALGIHVNTVYVWLKDGTLKSRQYGGRHYIPRAELAKLGELDP